MTSQGDPAVRIVRVAVPVPLAGALDYHVSQSAPRCLVGCRARVPLGRRRLIGVVVECPAASAIDPARVRSVEQIVDAEPVLPAPLIALLGWCARYYHRAIGDVFAAALPAQLRSIHARDAPRARLGWQAIEPPGAPACAELERAPRQRAILAWLAASARPKSGAEIAERFARAAQPLRALEQKGLVQRQPLASGFEHGAAGARPALTAEQAEADARLDALGAGFSAALVDGVTGSGKTELYCRRIDRALAAGRQTLYLLPEIGLTPQLVARIRQRFDARIGVLHSRRTPAERLDVWQAAAAGTTDILIGTRSAVFTPMPRLGLIVIDEEHDPSFKQQEGFRYHARDVATKRAREAGIPIVLGSATPSLETLKNARAARFTHLRLRHRPSGAPLPLIQLIDIRSRTLDGGLSEPLLARLQPHLARGDQVMVLINRRGFAPVYACHACGWTASCRHCDAYLTLHRAGITLRCHHCGASAAPPAVCPDCGDARLIALGAGTERVAEALAARFPDVTLARFDRDSVAPAGALDRQLAAAASGAARLLVGTQMLAKGHDFARLTCVAIVGADGGLFATDFRATEQLAQLVVQAAGRAGRDRRPGEVWLQTRHPEHPVFARLRSGYADFATAELDERRAAGLPPYGYLALLRADARSEHAPQAFLRRAAARVPAADDLACWGPVPAPMQRRAGRYRAQLLLAATRRARLHPVLDRWQAELAHLPGAARVQWSIDVDPVTLL